MKFERICVFCGSASGTRIEYARATVELGQELISRGYGLIYGGGSVGLMGDIAIAVSSGGGKVTGIIPKSLEPVEISGHSVGDVVIVKDMHERKARMFKDSDAFIALPGGFGTLEELLEVITWRQLGHHDKPIGCLNVAGYFDLFLSFLETAVDEGFISSSAKKLLITARTPVELLDKMEKSAENLRESRCALVKN